MWKILHFWYEKYFSHEEVVVLLLLIVGSALVIGLMGRILAPVFTAIVIAYLLQGMVVWLIRWGIPKLASILLVYILFIGILLAATLVLLPLTWGQLVNFMQVQLPRLLMEIQSLVQMLPERYPELITAEQTNEWIVRWKETLTQLGDHVLSFSVSVIPNLLGIVIFLVLVPVLVFFFLKDKDDLVKYILSWLPEERSMIVQIWHEMDRQVSNYVRGKFVEIMIVGSVTYIALVAFGVNYAALLGSLVGLSVIVPYIGATVVTVPIMIVGYFQFGFGSEWVTLMIIYGVIQALDGNVLVPLLFSEAVNLHPVSIIVAVLIFGGIWGFWGVFFAIPLATLVKAVVSAWPSSQVVVAGHSG